jgi:hypothetical protein
MNLRKGKILPPHSWEAHPLADTEDAHRSFMIITVTVGVLVMMSLLLLGNQQFAGQATGASVSTGCPEDQQYFSGNNSCVPSCTNGKILNNTGQCVAPINCEAIGQVGCNIPLNPLKHLICMDNVCANLDCVGFLLAIGYGEKDSGDNNSSNKDGPLLINPKQCNQTSSCDSNEICARDYTNSSSEGVCMGNDFISGLFESCSWVPDLCSQKKQFLNLPCGAGEGGCQNDTECLFPNTCELAGGEYGPEVKICKSELCPDWDDDFYTSNAPGTCTKFAGMKYDDCNDQDPTVTTCSAGYHCANSKCVLDCDSCTPGQKRCSIDKHGIETCVAKNNLCNEWVVKEPCDAGLVCKDAQCQYFWCLSDTDCGDYGEGASCVSGQCKKLAVSADPIQVTLRLVENTYTLATTNVHPGKDYTIELIIKPDIKLPAKHIVMTTITSGGVEVARFWQALPQLPIKQTETVFFQHYVTALAPGTSGAMKVKTQILGEFNGSSWTELVPAKEVSYAVS